MARCGQSLEVLNFDEICWMMQWTDPSSVIHESSSLIGKAKLRTNLFRSWLLRKYGASNVQCEIPGCCGHAADLGVADYDCKRSDSNEAPGI